MRNFIELGPTDFRTEFVGMFVHGGADSQFAKFGNDVFRMIDESVVERQHAHLFRRKPCREISRKMFDQNPDEAFERAERRAVNHDRATRRVVRTRVGQIEAFRQVEIDLHGAELPAATERIFHDKVDFRSVKCRFALFFDHGNAERCRRRAAGVFGAFPIFVLADVFIGFGIAQTDAHGIIFHAERGQNDVHELEAGANFLVDLVFRAENVSVVLRKAAHAGQPVEFAGLFPAVNGTELGEAHGQLAVGMRLRGVKFDVERAIHRLEQEAVERSRVKQIRKIRAGFAFRRERIDLLLVNDRSELRFAIIRKVPRRAEKIEISDVRREHLAVALAEKFFADKRLKLLANDGAVRRPQHQALPDGIVDGKKFQLLAEFAVVAFFRFLEIVQIFFELRLRRERHAVNTLELLVFFVAAMIRSRDGEQLHGFDLRGVAHVRSRAKVEKFAVAVERDFFAFGNIGKAAGFKFAERRRFRNQFFGFFAGNFEAFELLVFFSDFFHLRLDFFEVFRREFVFKIEIVVKPVVRSGSDVEFSVREKTKNGGRKHVRRAVAEFLNGCHCCHN